MKPGDNGKKRRAFEKADYSGDKWAGPMDWEEAREIIKRHYAEWVAGGWQL